MATMTITWAENEPLFTDDRLADYPCYMCFKCTQATSQSRCESHRLVYSLSTMEDKTGNGREGDKGVGGSEWMQRCNGGGGCEGAKTDLGLPWGRSGLGVPANCDLLSAGATQLT